jgi:hypothetical protein
VAIRVYDELPFGFSWTIDEPMERTSHALVDDGRVWLIDPVDDGDAIERATRLGEPVAVLRLLDRHGRDANAVAARLTVPLLSVPRVVPDSPFQVVALVDRPWWREVALWWPQQRALIVPEAVATSAMLTGGATRVGVHMLLRLRPPRKLAAFAPEHLLVGHGPGVHGPDTPAALSEALHRSARDLPRVLVNLPKTARR